MTLDTWSEPLSFEPTFSTKNASNPFRPTHQSKELSRPNGHNIDPQDYNESPWDFPEHFKEQYVLISRPYLKPLSAEVIEAKAEAESKREERQMDARRNI